MQIQCTIYFLEVTYLKCTVKHKVDNIVAVKNAALVVKGTKSGFLSKFSFETIGKLLKSQGDGIERIGSQREKNINYRKQSQFGFVLVLIWIIWNLSI